MLLVHNSSKFKPESMYFTSINLSFLVEHLLCRKLNLSFLTPYNALNIVPGESRSAGMPFTQVKGFPGLRHMIGGSS